MFRISLAKVTFLTLFCVKPLFCEPKMPQKQPETNGGKIAGAIIKTAHRHAFLGSFLHGLYLSSCTNKRLLIKNDPVATLLIVWLAEGIIVKTLTENLIEYYEL